MNGKKISFRLKNIEKDKVQIFNIRKAQSFDCREVQR